MALGALHFTFLWHGDIIFVYGLFGLLLTAFFFRTDRTLKIWTRIVFIFSSTLILLVGALAFLAERLFPEESFQAPQETRLDEVLSDGSFFDSVPPRLEMWAYGVSTGVFLQGGMAFAAFLLGLRMARANFLSSPIDTKQNNKLIKTGLFLGAPIQIIAAVILLQNEQSADPSEATYLIALFASFVAAPLMSMFYIGVIRKLVEEKPQLVEWMKPAGKMSLTIYISQSVITAWIFSSWGLGLFQELQTWQVLILAFGIWLFLANLTTIWLNRFKQGPLEFVMGSLTKGKS
jgi:uncharacterized protein